MPVAEVPDEASGLLPLVVKHCATQPDAQHWSLQTFPIPDPWWIMVASHSAIHRMQGWKLHVSASIACVETTLERVLPVLFDEHVQFKVVFSIERLHALNWGEAGYSQIGKAITIYPDDDAQAVLLAQRLGDVTAGLRGPKIPSDRSLLIPGRVSYRYGEFYSKHAVEGPVASVLRAPDGTTVPDLRAPQTYELFQADDPFLRAGLARPGAEVNPLIKARYLPLQTLAQSARGAVARAVDVRAKRLCIVKRAARDGIMSRSGLDARDYLRRSADFLRRFAADPRFPDVYELFEYEADLMLVTADVPGITLAEFIRHRSQVQQHISLAHVVALARGLAHLLSAIHKSGYVYGDLNAVNVLVAPDRSIRLVDFDTVYAAGSGVEAFHCGTPGLASPQYQRGETPSVSDDIYSFGALWRQVARQCDVSLAPEADYERQRPKQRATAHEPPAVARIFARCMHPEPEQRYPSMQAIDTALASV